MIWYTLKLIPSWLVSIPKLSLKGGRSRPTEMQRTGRLFLSQPSMTDYSIHVLLLIFLQKWKKSFRMACLLLIRNRDGHSGGTSSTIN